MTQGGDGEAVTFPPRGDYLVFLYSMFFCILSAIFCLQFSVCNSLSKYERREEFSVKMGASGMREPNEWGAALKLAMAISICVNEGYTPYYVAQCLKKNLNAPRPSEHTLPSVRSMINTVAFVKAGVNERPVRSLTLF